MDTIKINVDVVEYCIESLINYDDPYTDGIVSTMKCYLEHKNFKKMRYDLETVPNVNVAFHNLWDINARLGFLEVIYPS